MDGADASTGFQAASQFAVAIYVGRDPDGKALVRLPHANDAVVQMRSAIALGPADIGVELVAMMGGEDFGGPIVLGRLTLPTALPALEATADGERLEFTAEREIVLRCGKASVTLTRSGRIILRGTDILSRSSGPNRIRGGSIQLN